MPDKKTDGRGRPRVKDLYISLIEECDAKGLGVKETEARIVKYARAKGLAGGWPRRRTIINYRRAYRERKAKRPLHERAIAAAVGLAYSELSRSGKEAAEELLEAQERFSKVLERLGALDPKERVVLARALADVQSTMTKAAGKIIGLPVSRRLN